MDLIHIKSRVLGFFKIFKITNRKFNYNNTLFKLKLYKTVFGLFYLPNLGFEKNDIVIQSIRNNKIFDLPIVEKILEHYEFGTTILDVGSNFGQMSIYLANEVLKLEEKYKLNYSNPVKVVAFEAEPTILEILKKNIQINKLDEHIKVIGKPIWSESNINLVFPEPDLVKFGSWGSYGIDPKLRHGRTLISTTLDEQAYNLKVSIVKIDIQGSDLEAIKGMRKIISKNQPIIIFEYEEMFSEKFDSNFQSYLEVIESLQYEIFWNYQNNFAIRPKKLMQ